VIKRVSCRAGPRGARRNLSANVLNVPIRDPAMWQGLAPNQEAI
jgi:hypothetical protein